MQLDPDFARAVASESRGGSQLSAYDRDQSLRAAIRVIDQIMSTRNTRSHRARRIGKRTHARVRIMHVALRELIAWQQAVQRSEKIVDLRLRWLRIAGITIVECFCGPQQHLPIPRQKENRPSI